MWEHGGPVEMHKCISQAKLAWLLYLQSKLWKVRHAARCYRVARQCANLVSCSLEAPPQVSGSAEGAVGVGASSFACFCLKA